MKQKLKQILSLILASSMLIIGVPAFAQNIYLVDIGFDDVVTNDSSPYVSVDGSSSARVVEDGKNNKSYTVECENVDNTLKVFLPEYIAPKQYAVQFDMRIEGAPVEGKITLSNPDGIEEDLITLDDKSGLRAGDNKFLGYATSKRMQTVTIMINNEMKSHSIGVNGKIYYFRHDMGVALSNVSEIAISTYATKAKSNLYIDNVRIYGGTNYINKPTKSNYNYSSFEYIAEDEAGLADKVYYKNILNSSSAMSMTKLQKRNTIEWIGEGDGGFCRITKTTPDDAMIDMNIGQTTKRLIVQADIRFNKSAPETLFYLRDNSQGATVNVAPATVTGDRVVAQGHSKQLRKNVWYTISVQLDIAKHKYNVWVDGEKIAEDLSFSTDFQNISIWRMYVGGSSYGSVDIDNLALYGGIEPRDITNDTVTAKSRYSDKTALSILNGKRALELYASTEFINGVKTKLETPIIIEHSDALVPKDVFERFYGVTVSQNGNAVSIGDVKLSLDSKTITVGSKSYTMTCAPKIENGILYIPARAYGKYAQPKGFVDDGHGMLIIGNNLDKNDARLKQANLYMFFDRKSADTLKEQFLNNTDNGNMHPRLIATKDDFNRLKTEVRTDSQKSEWHQKIINQANNYITRDHLEYKITDGRLLDVANGALLKMEWLGYAYQMTGDRKYADYGIAELLNLCSFSDWHPDHFLDTGTLASAVAIGFDWLYDAMSDEERETISKSAQRLALEPAKSAYFASATFNDFWADTETNWGIIVNGGIANLAIATGEYDTDEKMEILYNALRSIEIPWYRIAPDGAWYEGTGYWGYLLTHLSLFMSAYKTSMGETFGENYMGMREYGYFQAYFQGPDGLSNNFHDADEVTVDNPGQFYLAGEFDDESLMLYRLDQMRKFNIAPTIFDVIWCDAGLSDKQSSIELEKEKYYGETEFVALRGDWNDDNSSWLSFHGGYSNNAHDHVDAGTFVYNIGGVRWAVETGREMLSYVGDAQNPSILAGYTSKYFYRRKGEGHNIVVIDPDANLEQDISQFAEVSRPVGGVSGAYATIDLTSAYNQKVNKYVRGYLLTDNRRTLTVRDEIELKGKSSMHWFMHTRGDIRIIDNNTALIYQDGKILKLKFLSNAESATLKAVEAKPLPTTPQFENTPNLEFTKIDYEVTGSNAVNITVKMSLLDEIGSQSGVDDVSISDWGTLINKPAQAFDTKDGSARLSGIYADGEMIKDFSPNKYSYTVSKLENGRSPEITIGNGDRAERDNYKRFDGSEAVVFTLTDTNGKKTAYTVNITDYDIRSLTVYNKYSLTAIDASSEQVTEDIDNCKEHSTDNDYTTRWSANGPNEWCIYDLGEVKTIDAFAAAFWMGSQRHFKFEIAVSDDGRNFTKVLNTVSDVYTEDALVYVPDSTVRARYIKFIGHGSNANDWNNVIEFMALTKKE